MYNGARMFSATGFCYFGVETKMRSNSPDSAVNVLPTPGGPLSSIIMPRPVRDIRNDCHYHIHYHIKEPLRLRLDHDKGVVG